MEFDHGVVAAIVDAKLRMNHVSPLPGPPSCQCPRESSVHRGCSDTPANANANFDAPRKFASDFLPLNIKQKAANYALRRNSLANASGFANETAKISS